MTHKQKWETVTHGCQDGVLVVAVGWLRPELGGVGATDKQLAQNIDEVWPEQAIL